MKGSKPGRGITLPFMMPRIVGRQYVFGKQINAPGETCTPYGSFSGAIPWPQVVPTINALANFAGIPRAQPIAPVINTVATVPSNYFYLWDVVQKSQG